MEKGEERVEVSFLIFMLRRFGFEEWNVDLLFRTLANTWFSVLVNGEPMDLLKSSRGVRQGDPLSLALFLLVAEFFGHGLLWIFLQNTRRYFASSGKRVSYLAFADDVLVFTQCSEDCLETFKQFFQQYQVYSGQKVNAAKNVFIISNKAAEEQVVLVSSKLGFQRQSLSLGYWGYLSRKGRVGFAYSTALLQK